MLTPEQLVQAGIFMEADVQDCLWVESGIGWLKVHTTLPLEQINGDTVMQLPAGAKLFLQQYCDLMQRGGVASEQIEGLSQSFTADGLESLLIQLAQNLLPEYFIAFRFVPKVQQWNYPSKGGCCYD